MKQITSRRQDSQAKRELLRSRCLELKLKHFDNDAIATQLYKEGLGVERDGELTKAYSPAYIGSTVREALKEVAAQRGTYGKEMAIVIENDLDDLISAWRPLALGEKEDDDGNLLPPSVKAAEIVRKCLSDKSVLLGSNAPVEQIISVRVESALDGFVSTMRALMPESSFADLLTAIDKAGQLNSEYWEGQKELNPADSATIDVEVES